MLTIVCFMMFLYLETESVYGVQIIKDECSMNDNLELMNRQMEEQTTDQLLQEMADLLIKNGKTVSTAESCTGGYISHLITSKSGSSVYYKGSVISYSNEVKVNLLGVNSVTIESYGAVSKQTAEEMAKGAIQILKTDYAIAVTGIAGPSGGTLNKPVGTVWIAVADEDSVVCKLFNFNGDRGENIRSASHAAIRSLIERLNTL